MSRDHFTENTVVRLRPEVALKKRRPTAMITGFVFGVPGGVVLDERLDGFRCWNTSDLEIVEKKRRKK